jgi:arylsulfatase A-like enzyme
MADDASYPYMGAYGTRWTKTPAFDSVASAGILFMNAFTPNAKCAPSRACFLTGRNSWQLEAAANHWPYFPEKFKTLFEALSDNGYHTGHTLKGWAPGKQEGGRQRLLTGKAYNDRKITAPTDAISNIDYAGNFRDFLDARPPESPFCFWYGSIEPHRAYAYGSGKELGDASVRDIDRVPDYWPDTDTVRMDMLDYAYELNYFDLHIGRMLQLLRERGELDNTIVIITADNGMPFPRVKGQAYEASNHLPLAIMWGAGIVDPGRRSWEYVNFIDFAPTLLSCAGVKPGESGMAQITGKSFARLFEHKKDRSRPGFVLLGKERHDIGRPDDGGYPIRGIRTKRYLYLANYEPERWPAGNPETGYLNVDGSATKSKILQLRRQQGKSVYWDQGFGKRPAEELYDLEIDPDCLTNMATLSAMDDVRRKLRKQMESLLRKQGDPRMEGRGQVFDDYPYADDGGRDFYDRFRKGERMQTNWVNDSDFEAAVIE